MEESKYDDTELTSSMFFSNLRNTKAQSTLSYINSPIKIKPEGNAFKRPDTDLKDS